MSLHQAARPRVTASHAVGKALRAGTPRCRLQLRACAPAPGGGGGADNSTATLASWLRRQRVLLSEPEPSDQDILQLSVGGAVMVTSRSTLRQVPGSLLFLLFDPANERLLLRDTAGRVFLDHDPAAFGLVLRYLRELRLTGGEPQRATRRRCSVQQHRTACAPPCMWCSRRHAAALTGRPHARRLQRCGGAAASHPAG